MTRVVMVVYSYYPADPRVRREAEALAENGVSVDVICLKKDQESRFDVHHGVSVHRLSVSRSRSGKMNYIFEYGLFILYAFLKVSLSHFRKRYDIVHVHNMPDILIFTGLLARIMGAKIVLDLHDPMPELYMAKYDIGAAHPAIKLLRLLEKASISCAHLVLTTNISFCELFISRGCPAEKMHIVMNSPQEDIFLRENRDYDKQDDAKGAGFTLMYHGTIVERNGLDTALQALARVRETIHGLRFLVYGEGDFVDQFLKLVTSLQLEDIVQYYGHVSLEEIARTIRSADLGVIPNKRNAFTEINFPTRIFEYICLGRPVIAPRTTGIKDYFDEDSLIYFEPGDAHDLARAICVAYENTSKREEVLQKGIKVYNTHRWEVQKTYFVGLIARLSAGNN